MRVERVTGDAGSAARGAVLGVGRERQEELTEIATSMRRPLPNESWSKGIEQLFRAIANKVEGTDEELELELEPEPE